MTTRDEVQAALAWLSPDCGRDDWWRALAAVKAALGEAGQDLARDWSAGGASFDPGAFRDTWRSLRAHGGITAASLFAAARVAGWRDMARAEIPNPNGCKGAITSNDGMQFLSKSEYAQALDSAGISPQTAHRYQQLAEVPRSRATTPPPRPSRASAVVENLRPMGHKLPTSERDTAAYAREIWARVTRDDAAVADHPYATRKGIRHAAGAGRATVSGSRIGRDADCLVVPLRDLAQEVLLGVEVISADGIKQTYGRRGVLILGNELDLSLPITVVEGWASAAVLVFGMFAGKACAIVAGGKGRMDKTATDAENRWPGRVVVIAEELDA